MRLMFIYYVMDDAGSAQDIYNYARVAKALGHEIAVYGRPEARSAFNFSLDIESADAVIFIFEWTTQLRSGDALDIVRLMHKAPRERRIVIDCDGNYNDAISIGGDYNHRDAAASRVWTDVCESLADKIYQPTLHPLRRNVRPFFFHAYDPAWEKPLDFSAKEYGMVYVGHSKFRWWPMHRVLQAIEPLRPQVGRIGLVGHGWEALPPWAVPMQIEDFYYTDPAYLRQLDVEIIPPIPFNQVIAWMSKAAFNPVIYRPLFSHLQLVTCRTFETPAASTIPLFGLDIAYVREMYGERATELVLLDDDHPEEKIADIMRRPEYYAEIVLDMRRHLTQKHSYAVRLQELIEVVKT